MFVPVNELITRTAMGPLLRQSRGTYYIIWMILKKTVTRRMRLYGSIFLRLCLGSYITSLWPDISSISYKTSFVLGLFITGNWGGSRYPFFLKYWVLHLLGGVLSWKKYLLKMRLIKKFLGVPHQGNIAGTSSELTW